MKQFFSIALVFLATWATAGDKVMQGVYQGRNLFVKNAFAPDGVGFCAFQVLVNNEVTSDEVNSSAFEIDLAMSNLQLGDKLEIVIKCKDDCVISVINPEAISPKSTFEVKSASVNQAGLLNFKTTGESGQLPFFVEQFKWNKWVRVGVVEGKGSGGSNEYVFQADLTFGENKFRVRQKDLDGIRAHGPILVQSPMAEPIAIAKMKVSDVLTFSAPTGFEIFSEFGELKSKGFDDKVDMSSMPSGKYYVNFDNTLGAEISKK